MAHRLARALLLVLAVLLVGLAGCPATAAVQRPPAGTERSHDGETVERTSPHVCCPARPAGPDHPSQLAPPSVATALPRPSAHVTPGCLDPELPVGHHTVCAESRGPPRAR